jgi:hypothetical protein
LTEGLLNRLRCQTRIVANELGASIDDHLRRVDAAQSKAAGVGVLAIAEKARGVGIGPANVVPVIHVLAQYDQLRPSDGLRTLKLLQQRVGLRANLATFRGKKLN